MLITFFTAPARSLVWMLAALCCTLTACEWPVGASETSCEVETTLTAALGAADLGALQVVAGSGALEVVGEASADSIVVRGRACAPDELALEQVTLEASRDGDAALVETDGPEGTRLDLVVEVPAALALGVTDGSGSVAIAGVAAVDVLDGSGDLLVEDVAGPVTIIDASGSMEVARTGGTVRITDGSGDVLIEFVTGDVVIESDGSGDIRVTDVEGDLVVSADSSGQVEYERIGGAVRLP